MKSSEKDSNGTKGEKRKFIEKTRRILREDKLL